MKVLMRVPHDHHATEEPTQPLSPEHHGSPARDPRVDARKLWSGGAASAGVAALTALVGVQVSRWLFNLPVLAPGHDAAYGDTHTTTIVLAAAAAALAATGLVHLLLATTPRPILFFGWVVALVTTLAVIYPFSTIAPMGAKMTTAVVVLAIGAMIGTLVSGAAARSTVNAGSRTGSR